MNIFANLAFEIMKASNNLYKTIIIFYSNDSKQSTNAQKYFSKTLIVIIHNLLTLKVMIT